MANSVEHTKRLHASILHLVPPLPRPRARPLSDLPPRLLNAATWLSPLVARPGRSQTVRASDRVRALVRWWLAGLVKLDTGQPMSMNRRELRVELDGSAGTPAARHLGSCTDSLSAAGWWQVQ